MFLAAYLGPSGSLQSLEISYRLSLNDPYFLNQNGTSFSAPIVSGGIALLKDAVHSYEGTPFEMSETTLDTRVVKSVHMAGARRTEGWDNGQDNEDGVLITTRQSAGLVRQSAGALDGDHRADLSSFPPRKISPGWAAEKSALPAGTLGHSRKAPRMSIALPTPLPRKSNSPSRSIGLPAPVLMKTISDRPSVSPISIREVWLLTEDDLTTKIAESISIYNNSEVSRIGLSLPGEYALPQVTFSGMVYDLDSFRPTIRNTGWRGRQGRSRARHVRRLWLLAARC